MKEQKLVQFVQQENIQQLDLHHVRHVKQVNIRHLVHLHVQFVELELIVQQELKVALLVQMELMHHQQVHLLVQLVHQLVLVIV